MMKVKHDPITVNGIKMTKLLNLVIYSQLCSDKIKQKDDRLTKLIGSDLNLLCKRSGLLDKVNQYRFEFASQEKILNMRV